MTDDRIQTITAGATQSVTLRQQQVVWVVFGCGFHDREIVGIFTDEGAARREAEKRQYEFVLQTEVEQWNVI